MIETVSKYKNNVIAKKTRIFISMALDFGLVFISSLLIFYLTLLGGSKLPVSTQNVEKYNTVTVDAKKFINRTHLMHYDTETQMTREVAVDAKNYVVSLVKTSAYVFDIAYPVEKEDSTYDTTHKVSVEETFINEYDKHLLNNVVYFWAIYHLENLNDFTYGRDIKPIEKTPENIKNIVIGTYENKFGYISKEGFKDNFVNEDVEEYQTYKDTLPIYAVLNKENTQALINKLVYSDATNETANTLYTDLVTCYKNGIQTGIDEVEKYSVAYKGFEKEFYSAYHALAMVGFVAYIIAYTVGYIAVLFIGRAMSGSYITLCQKTLNLALARSDEMSPKPVNIILYHVVNYFVYLASMALSLFFTGYIGVLNLPLVGPLNFFTFEIFSLVLLVASIIILIITKKNQTLALLVSNMVVKDTRDFETAVVDGERLLNSETPKEDGKSEE